jgi:hypothetical protein
MKCRILVQYAGAAGLGALLIGQTSAAAQSDPWLTKSQKLQMRPLHDTLGRVRLDYPHKDWLVTPGGGDALLTLTEKRAEAAVFLEAVRMTSPLAPEEITDLFAKIEVETIQERDPRAASFTSRLLDVDGRRIVVIEYSRQGLLGPERVRQYSYPAGTALYRLICSASVAKQPKYASIFSHMAASLTFESR